MQNVTKDIIFVIEICQTNEVHNSKYKKVGVLPIRIVWSNVSSIGPSSERNRK